MKQSLENESKLHNVQLAIHSKRQIRKKNEIFVSPFNFVSKQKSHKFYFYMLLFPLSREFFLFVCSLHFP